MPLLLNIHPFEDATFSLWKVTEPLSFFEEDLPLSEAEAAELAVLREHRRGSGSQVAGCFTTQPGHPAGYRW
jgi:hypothetical protein